MRVCGNQLYHNRDGGYCSKRCHGHLYSTDNKAITRISCGKWFKGYYVKVKWPLHQQPGPDLALLPAGTFTMGSPSDEPGRYSNETQHPVTLTQPFYMQTTEVTQAQWEAVMGSNPSDFQGCPTCPVETYLVERGASVRSQRWTHGGEGTYGLPTEAQWEYAARAGSTAAFYNGGITVTDCGYDPNLNAIGWYVITQAVRPIRLSKKPPMPGGI